MYRAASIHPHLGVTFSNTFLQYASHCGGSTGVGGMSGRGFDWVHVGVGLGGGLNSVLRVMDVAVPMDVVVVNVVVVIVEVKVVVVVDGLGGGLMNCVERVTDKVVVVVVVVVVVEIEVVNDVVVNVFVSFPVLVLVSGVVVGLGGGGFKPVDRVKGNVVDGMPGVVVVLVDGVGVVVVVVVLVIVVLVVDGVGVGTVSGTQRRCGGVEGGQLRGLGLPFTPSAQHSPFGHKKAMQCLSLGSPTGQPSSSGGPLKFPQSPDIPRFLYLPGSVM
jgi:hypothetical protein